MSVADFMLQQQSLWIVATEIKILTIWQLAGKKLMTPVLYHTVIIQVSSIEGFRDWELTAVVHECKEFTPRWVTELHMCVWYRGLCEQDDGSLESQKTFQGRLGWGLQTTGSQAKCWEYGGKRMWLMCRSFQALKTHMLCLPQRQKEHGLLGEVRKAQLCYSTECEKEENLARVVA